MTDWIILVESANDIAQTETRHKVMRISDYLANPALFAGRRPYVLNLARSYGYQSEGYYASLLAEARGHRVSPGVATMVELSAKGLYANAVADLSESAREAQAKGAKAPASLFIAFSKPDAPGYERFAREASDWFRAPALEIEFDAEKPSRILRIRLVSPHRLKGERRAFFLDAMARYTEGRPAAQKRKAPAKWSLAVLVDPDEKTPPSNQKSLARLIDVGAKMGVEIELLDLTDYPSLAEFDALFIRTTTAINNPTYRFARRAEQEGMPVIDDPTSMIRCTNKVFLKEILEAAHVPIPPTEIISEKSDLAAVMARLGSPVIVKLPDGSFGAKMAKAETLEAFRAATKEMFRTTALLVAQGFMPTAFDWRIGVLGGEALYACQYRMARGHWQIIRHGDDGKMTEGGFRTLPVADAPPAVIDAAVRAARLMGDGLYGVDLKETEAGVVVIEVNDNPNLEHDVEGAVLKDELWRRLIKWFESRLEARLGGAL